MFQAIRSLDKLLRGESTTLPVLRAGGFDVPVWGLIVVIDALGLLYGACMGVYSLTAGNHARMQILATMIKVPALFLLTLAVTLPSLYVFNTLVGSRLMFHSILKLLVAALAVMLAVLSSIGPIVGFFSFTTTSYPFMVVLNVAVYTISGALGLMFLLQTLHRLSIVQSVERALPIAVEPIAEDGSVPARPVIDSGPLDISPNHVLARHVRIVFRIWVLVFGLVGAQMAWVLRPFIGHPHAVFTWFRPVGSNFFESVYQSILALLH